MNLNEINDNQLIINGFKDIYSSLNAMGQLSAGNVIAKGGDGTESGWSIARKCLTFNAKTPTEHTLDALLAAFNKYALNSKLVVNFFTSDVFNDAIQQVQDEYSNDCFLSQDQIKSFCQEVADVGAFVKEYFCQEKAVVKADFYSRRNVSWNALFFNDEKPKVKPEIKEIDEAALLLGNEQLRYS